MFSSQARAVPSPSEPGGRLSAWPPVVSRSGTGNMWIWHLFDLGEFISYLYRDKSYWNLIIQGLNWILYLSLCRNFYRKSQQTHWSFMCNFILDVTPLKALLAQLDGGGGKAVSKKPPDPNAKMPEPFRPIPALSGIPSCILRGCEAPLFLPFWNLAVVDPICHSKPCQAGLLINILCFFLRISSCFMNKNTKNWAGFWEGKKKLKKKCSFINPRN